jgi:hypothetical protein
MGSPKPQHPKTTNYNAFPEKPRPGCSLAAVFWVVKNDHRVLSRNEKRNVVYPAKSAGLIEDAPANHLGVQINLSGETSRCDFILTEKGLEYFAKCVNPILPNGFTSDAHLPKRRRRSEDLSLADIKAGK